MTAYRFFLFKPSMRARATRVLAQTLVCLLSFTLIFSGILLPASAMAQQQPSTSSSTQAAAPVVKAPINAAVDNNFLSLKEVPRPVPKAAVIAGPIPGPSVDLQFQFLSRQIVKSQGALVRLGKALFWDMQAGSDGVQACATCHFNAGADIRSKNQLSPGIKDTNFHNTTAVGGDNFFGNSTVPFTANDPNTPFPPGPVQPAPAGLNVPGHPSFTPNYQLVKGDFPLNDWFIPTQITPRGQGVGFVEEFLNVSADTNDVVSSMGVRHTKFVGVTPGVALDLGSNMSDVFNTANPGKLDVRSRVRRVEPRNAPTVINAVFNLDNFWDGRASFIFNGVNPFGFRDQTSTLWMNDPVAGLTSVFLRVTNSSLASQSVGPPGSNFEMSWEGRSFPDIGKKMVSMQPLANQVVDPTDSVLGLYAKKGGKGLKIATYSDMIQAAFQDKWWNSTDVITVNAATAAVQRPSANDPRTMVLSPGQATSSPATGAPLASNQYSQIQFNFSMFWGLAIQAYEATLISDDAPFDRFMGAPTLGIAGDPTALTDQELLGLTLFMDTSPIGPKCNNCHFAPVFSNQTIVDIAPDAQGVPAGIIEFMIMGDGTIANYDQGFYNIGVRRTTEDLCRAGTAPDSPPFQNALNGNKPFPLSYVELTALRSAGKLPPDVARFVPDVPVLDRRVTSGSFKAPILRNVEFTGPYFHAGDSATLRQVVEFYTRGGNFPNTNFANLDVDIDGIPGLQFPNVVPSAETNIEGLVAFLSHGLTDQRVALEQAPFDHPQLFVPNGSPDGHPDQDILMEVPAVGKAGHATPVHRFLDLDPQTP